MKDLAGADSQAGGQPDSKPPEQSIDWSRIKAPSNRLELFEQRDRFFRLRHPSNWREYESEGSWGVTLAPEGGITRNPQGQNQIVYGVLVSRFDPHDSKVRDRLGRTRGPFAGRNELERSTNLLIQVLVEGNGYLSPNNRSTGEAWMDGERTLSMDLVGRSPVTKQSERATVVCRRLPNHELLYLILVIP